MVAIVYTSSAHMPTKVKAAYTNVMVLDVRYDLAVKYEQGKWRPHSCVAKGVRILSRHGKYPANGKTMKSGIQQALAAAREFRDRYNSSPDMATAEQIIGAGGSA